MGDMGFFNVFKFPSFPSQSINTMPLDCFVVFVYYLPKFRRNLQVCSFVGLLLAKIYNFWQVCSFVGLSVC